MDLLYLYPVRVSDLVLLIVFEEFEQLMLESAKKAFNKETGTRKNVSIY